MSKPGVQRHIFRDLPGRRPARQFAAAFGLFLMLGSLWSIASPISSYPDELAHAIKAAAVVNGQWLGQPLESQGEETLVSVPSYLEEYPKPPCFAFNAEVSAECTPSITAYTDSAELTTSAGNYNPLYYAIVGLPSLVLSGEAAWYAMRLVSVALTALFAAVSFCTISELRQPRSTLIGFAVACTPMVIYLMGGLNPQAVEIAAVTAVFTILLAVLERSGRSAGMWPLLVALICATVTAANTRALALLWLALAAGAAALLAGADNLKLAVARRDVQVAGCICTAGAAIGLLWVRSADPVKSLTGSGEPISKAQVFATMADRTFDYAAEYVGTFGWLDTPAPNAVYAFWSFLFIGIVTWALSIRPSPRLAAPALLLAAIVIIPPVAQSLVIDDVGYIWQGRYILPLVVVFTVACGYTLHHASVPNAGHWSRWRTLCIWLASASHVYAFVYVLRRYTVGISDEANWLQMLQAPLWQPPMGWITCSVVYAGVAAAVAVLLSRFLRPGPPRPEAHDSSCQQR